MGAVRIINTLIFTVFKICTLKKKDMNRTMQSGTKVLRVFGVTGQIAQLVEHITADAPKN
jgi:hypothetical protein